jgi:hypothetical protein
VHPVGRAKRDGFVGRHTVTTGVWGEGRCGAEAGYFAIRKMVETLLLSSTSRK